MPFTTTVVIGRAFSKEQKARLIEKVTEAKVEVEGEQMRELAWVTIEEIKAGHGAIGGKFPRPKTQGP